MSTNSHALTAATAITTDIGGGSDHHAAEEHREWMKETRGWLIVIATLAASVTYQAGLNPPGGFWQDSQPDPTKPMQQQDPTKPMHVAGNPVLHDDVEFKSRYFTFYYFNATAFATSLVIISLLLSERFYKSEAKVAALKLTTMIDLMSLVGAYIAGSTRDMRSSIYIIVLVCFLFVCVIYISRVLPNMCFVVLFMVPPLWMLARNGWLPVTDHLKKRVESAIEREKDDDDKKKEERKKAKEKKGCICCRCCRASKYDEA